MSNSGIYLISCLFNQKKYVGQSIDVSGRIQAHKTQLERGTHHNKAMQADYDMYGAVAFHYQVQEMVNRADLNVREIYWFEWYAQKFEMYNFPAQVGMGMDHSALPLDDPRVVCNLPIRELTKKLCPTIEALPEDKIISITNKGKVIAVSMGIDYWNALVLSLIHI